MAFRFRKNESAAAGIRRTARELIDDSIDLAGKKKNEAETVHELRKELKKLRALLRLARGELGEDVFDRENTRVRDLGRLLSAARDASVRESAFGDLMEKLEDVEAKKGMAVVHGRLRARRAVAARQLRGGPAFSKIVSGLHGLRRNLRAWPITKSGFDGFSAGLRKVYRQGRRAKDEAFRTKIDGAFHEWRKRVKDLRYHIELLEPVWENEMRELEKTLHDLTDALGDDHDLADLRQVLTSSPRLTRGVGGVSRVLDFIDKRRSQLQAQARPIGDRVYAEKPGAFAKRIEGYWDAWRS